MSAGPVALARADLAERLSTLAPEGVTVIANMPERLDPPCVVIGEGSPLVSRGTAFGEVVVRLTATIVTAPVDNALAVSRLDATLDQMIEGLWPDTVVDEVGPYQTVTTADGQPYLSVTLTTLTNLTITKD